MSTRAVEAWTLEPLVKFVKEAGARLVLVMTSAGQVLAQHGFSRAMDVMSAAALGAAPWAKWSFQHHPRVRCFDTLEAAVAALDSLGLKSQN